MTTPTVSTLQRVRSSFVGFIWVPLLFGFLCPLLALIINSPRGVFRKMGWEAGVTGCIQITERMSVFSHWVLRVGYWLEGVEWQVLNAEALKVDETCLLISNHIAWTDPLFLHTLGKTDLPQRKFMFKEELQKIPVFGHGLSVMGMPPVVRISEKRQRGESVSELKENLRKKMQDSADYLSRVPGAIGIFAEGTRFTKDKQQRQKSPYNYLLKPRVSGVCYALLEMPQIRTVVNATIVYPHASSTATHYMFSGDHKWGVLHVEQFAVPAELDSLRQALSDPTISESDYKHMNKEFRHKTQSWLNSLWHQKDQLIGDILASN